MRSFTVPPPFPYLVFKIRYVFFSRSTSQLGPATYQALNSPVWPAGGPLPGRRRSNVSRSPLSRYLAQVPPLISKHWRRGGGEDGKNTRALMSSPTRAQAQTLGPPQALPGLTTPLR